MDGPSSSKRVLTEEGRESSATTDQSVLATGAGTEQLAVALRNVGARVRHRVSQGYRTPPSSFVKAQSTGTIFRSMNDTLRDMQGNLSTTNVQHSANSSKKRSHSITSDEPDGELDAESPGRNKSPEGLGPRPIKPLRSSFIKAPSMSALVSDHQMTKPKEDVEEDDWSLSMSSETAAEKQHQFEAMEL